MRQLETEQLLTLSMFISSIIMKKWLFLFNVEYICHVVKNSYLPLK